MSNQPEYAGDATTIAEALQRFEAAGFTGQFGVREAARVVCFTCHEESPAEAVELTALLRMEGASDPDDMVALAALRCPRCGALGTVALTYGPEAPTEEDEVLARFGDARVAEGIRPNP